MANVDPGTARQPRVRNLSPRQPKPRVRKLSARGRSTRWSGAKGNVHNAQPRFRGPRSGRGS